MQQRFDEGADIVEIARALSIKTDTLRKVVAAGKLHKPVKISVARTDHSVNAVNEK